MHEFERYLSELRRLLEVGPHRTQEICEEARCHLEAQTRELERSGLARGEAAARAMRAFGEPKAVARLLARANSQHGRLQTLKALAIGLLLGPPIFCLGELAHYLLQPVHFWTVTGPLYEAVAPGAIMGGLCALAVAHWRVRLRWLLAAWLSLPLLLTGWVAVLYLRLHGLAVGPSVRDMGLAEGLPLPLTCAALAAAVAWAVHRWVLDRPAPPSTPAGAVGRPAGSPR